jgi:prepilin-type N-terminal cleavage/methylation domain-containing protein
MHRGPTGFTLIELLIVVVIIGVLASIAVPKFSNSKEKSYLATMRSDLRNIAVAEEAYFTDEITYYDGPIPGAGLSYSGPSAGVSITLQDVTLGGWAAKATHVATPKTCAIFLGTAPALAPAVESGQVRCD